MQPSFEEFKQLQTTDTEAAVSFLNININVIRCEKKLLSKFKSFLQM